MTMMDWGDIGEFVTFGQVGHDQIDDASYYILIAPQNVVGNTILTNLGEMVRLCPEGTRQAFLQQVLYLMHMPWSTVLDSLARCMQYNTSRAV